jgi:hypothetical protein
MQAIRSTEVAELHAIELREFAKTETVPENDIPLLEVEFAYPAKPITNPI